MSPAAARTGPAAGPAQSGSDPVTLVVGEEELLVERAVSAAVAAVAHTGAAHTGAADTGLGGPDVHDVAAAGLASGELTSVTAPSLFGGSCVVVVRAVQDAGKDVCAELIRLASAPDPDVVLIVTHSGAEQETDAWASNCFDLVMRAFPKQAAQAREISVDDAHTAIAVKYRTIYPTASPVQIARLFGWTKAQAVTALAL